LPARYVIDSMAILARWLGPWANPRAAPTVAVRDEMEGGLRVRLYAPRGSQGAGAPRLRFARRSPRRTFLIAPGLHYAGADDPRMDRFCRILAAAGHLVVAPFVPDYLALTPTERAKRDFFRAFAALPRWSAQRPVVFSISFGSLLALSLAAEHPGGIERLVVFGGYADLRETLRFCLTGQVASGRATARDPLNQPVVLMNLLHLIDCADREAVTAGWRRYVERTWGRAELKVRERFVAIAEELAPGVPAGVRELFLVGIGARPGAAELALEALTRFDASALDPTPYLPRITGRVDLVHGAEDDVIPFEHSHALAAAMPNADVRVHVTGLYGHTGASRPTLASSARELVTMVRVLRALS
jgi:pimeloyl-ACP methyl ester carboxylesterase